VAYPVAKLVQEADVPLDLARLTHPFPALQDNLISFGIVGVFLNLGMCIVNHIRKRILRPDAGAVSGHQICD